MALSIGKIGGIGYDATSNRYKGVLTQVAENTGQVEAMLWQCVHRAGSIGTRMTVRIFTSFQDGERLKELQVPWGEAFLRCEAFIPHKWYSVAYFGANTPERTSRKETVAAEESLLAGVMATPPKKRETPEGFTVEILDRANPDDLADLLGVYNASYTRYITDFTRDSISRMIYENIVAVARNGDGRIVAVSQGETAEVPQLGVDLVELSDTATYPKYRSKGLTTLCKMRLIEALRGSEKAIVFAESRAVSAPVNRQNFSVGMKPGGRLERHCKIASDQFELPQDGEYGNMVVWYLPTT